MIRFYSKKAVTADINNKVLPAVVQLSSSLASHTSASVQVATGAYPCL